MGGRTSGSDAKELYKWMRFRWHCLSLSLLFLLLHAMLLATAGFSVVFTFAVMAVSMSFPGMSPALLSHLLSVYTPHHHQAKKERERVETYKQDRTVQSSAVQHPEPHPSRQQRRRVSIQRANWGKVKLSHRRPFVWTSCHRYDDFDQTRRRVRQKWLLGWRVDCECTACIGKRVPLDVT